MHRGLGFRAQRTSSVHSGRVLCTAGVGSVHSDAVDRRFTHARSCCSCLLDCVARHAVNHRTARRKDHPAPKQEGQVLRGGASCSTFSKKELRKEKIQVTEYKIPSLLVLLCDLYTVSGVLSECVKGGKG